MRVHACVSGTDPSCNIRLICVVMTDDSVGDEVARLAVVSKQQQTWLPMTRTHALTQLVSNTVVCSGEEKKRGRRVGVKHMPACFDLCLSSFLW